MKKVFILSVMMCALLYFTAPFMFGKNHETVNKSIIAGVFGPTGPAASHPLTDSAKNYFPPDRPVTDEAKNFDRLFPPGSPQRATADSLRALNEAKSKTSQMTTELHLSGKQVSQVSKINDDYFVQLHKLNSMVTSTTGAPVNKIIELKDKYTKSLNSVLTAGQSEQLKKQ